MFFNSSCFTRHYTRLVIVFFGNICNHLHARVRFVSTEEPDPVRSSSVKPLWLQTASCVASRCLVNMIEILMDVFHQKVLRLLLPAGVSVICWGGLEVSKVTRWSWEFEGKKPESHNIWSFDAWFSKETYYGSVQHWWIPTLQTRKSNIFGFL